MNILIFGASGYAGQEIKRRLTQEFTNVTGTYHNTVSNAGMNDTTMYSFDLSSTNNLNQLLEKTKPTVIIDCLRGDFTQQLDALRIMAEYLKNVDKGKMVFLSSANVYDGALNAPHYEDDPANAESDYGKFKIECETILQNTIHNKSIIIRIPEVYGKGCPRLNRLKTAGINHETIHTYKNLFVNYTTNEYIAEWILYILQHDLKGIFHIATEDISDYYDFQAMLLNSLQISAPVFEIEEEKEAIYQAVLSRRSDIPDWLRFEIKDVVKQMKESH